MVTLGNVNNRGQEGEYSKHVSRIDEKSGVFSNNNNNGSLGRLSIMHNKKGKMFLNPLFNNVRDEATETDGGKKKKKKIQIKVEQKTKRLSFAEEHLGINCKIKTVLILITLIFIGLLFVMICLHILNDVYIENHKMGYFCIIIAFILSMQRVINMYEETKNLPGSCVSLKLSMFLYFVLFLFAITNPTIEEARGGKYEKIEKPEMDTKKCLIITRM